MSKTRTLSTTPHIYYNFIFSVTGSNGLFYGLLLKVKVFFTTVNEHGLWDLLGKSVYLLESPVPMLLNSSLVPIPITHHDPPLYPSIFFCEHIHPILLSICLEFILPTCDMVLTCHLAQLQSPLLIRSEM